MQWSGQYQPCVGPRGISYNQSQDDMVSAYTGIPKGFPPPRFGSYDAVGLDGSVCFDRISRYSPYSEQKGDGKVLDWSKVRWGDLQNMCLERNQARYKPASRKNSLLAPTNDPPNTDDLRKFDGILDRSYRDTATGLSYRPRTAVLIRSYETYGYQPNDLEAIRSLIAELALQSGGEYQVFLLVNVKDRVAHPLLHKDPNVYQSIMNQVVPEEFRSMAVLWSEDLFPPWYPRVGEYDVYWQQFMILQWFSKTHPEFEYIWNWEMDARYIGHHYHFLESIVRFADKQPRRYLWERNARFYIPKIHGSYEEYTSNTNSIIDGAVKAGEIEPVWGPQNWTADQWPSIVGPQPPGDIQEDNFTWGVDESTDLITLLPIFDPLRTKWAYRDKLFNYGPDNDYSVDGDNMHLDPLINTRYPRIPRRVSINTLSRFSKRLLHAMHTENVFGFGMASELWPASVALQHGLKAVYAPHPIWTDRVWDDEYLESVFNADGTNGTRWEIRSCRAPAFQRRGSVAKEPSSPTKTNRATGRSEEVWRTYFH